MIVNFTVDGNPIPKARPRRVKLKTGRYVVFTPKTTMKWEAEIKKEAAKILLHAQRFEGRIAVILYFRRKDNVKCDIDNLAKGILDALNTVLWVDDRQVVALISHMERQSKMPGVDIKIMDLDDYAVHINGLLSIPPDNTPVKKEKRVRKSKIIDKIE